MTRRMKTGGRKAGTPNKATAAKAMAVEQAGLTPLDFMLKVMRDESVDLQERMQAARAAAPYVHPRLASKEYDALDPEAERERLEVDRRLLEYVDEEHRAKWEEIAMRMPMNREP